MIRGWQGLGAFVEIANVVHAEKTKTEICPGVILASYQNRMMQNDVTA